MRIGLGTVQFGLGYGLGHAGGRVDDADVRQILEIARTEGVDVLDTARAYGVAEEVLGRCLRPGHAFRIVTKTAPLKALRGTPQGEAACRQSLEESFRALRTEHVDTVLVHHADDLLAPGGEAVWGVLQQQKKSGRIRAAGVSVYDAGQIDALLARFDLDVVQLPLSAFDQRLLRSGHLQKLRQRGVEIHARSIFLQGLLLQDPDAVSPYFDPIRARLQAWDAAVRAAGVTRVAAALAFARSVPELDVTLMGVHSAADLQGNFRDWQASADVRLTFADFSVEDEAMVNPGRWRL